jgi:PAS domain S-box-containing protein
MISELPCLKHRRASVGHGDRGRVLVVEDDAQLLALHLGSLRRAGFAAVGVPDAEGCFAALCVELPELILLDIHLSDCDGRSLCQKLKSDPTTATVAIVYLSGEAPDGEPSGGADGHITRPISDGELIERLELILRAQRAEAKLRQATHSLQQVMTQSPDVICTINVAGEFVEMSAAAERILGYRREELLGRCSFDFIVPEDRAKSRAEAEAIMTGRETRGFENRYRHRDGSIVHIHWSASWSAADQTLFCVARDVTERCRNQQLLAESHERFLHVVRATNDSVWDWDLVANEVRWGDGFESVFGHPVNEIDPESCFWYQHIHPDERERVYAGIKEFIRNGTGVWADEYRFQCADGHYAYVHDRGHVIRDATGQAVRMIGGIVDLTERHEQEEKLRESEERFRQLTDNVEDVFWVHELAANRLTYINPAFEIVFGQARDGFYDNPHAFLEIVHTEDRERICQEVLKKPDALNEEFRIVRPSGAVRWVWARTVPIYDSENRLYRVAGIARDITERKEAEEVIHEQAALLDHAQEAIFVQDLRGKVLYWNRSAVRTYGCTASDIIGRHFIPSAESSSEQHAVAWRQVFEKGDWIGELVEQTKDGHEIIVEGHWTLVRDAAGAPKSILCINTDITEKKKLETQFLRTQRMESIGTLAGGIAHDLNNVLSPIVMAMELLKLQCENPANLDILNTVEKSARRGAEMVKQVLSFARGVEGQRVLVQPRHVLKDIKSIMVDTFPKNLDLKVRIAPDLWNVLGDPTQIHQVLLNLCVNSRDAMPDGGSIVITAKNVTFDENYAAMDPDAKPGPHVVLQVEDTGTGMTPAIIEKIFDPFFTTKEQGQGTGLGLSSSLAIVKSHGGFIRVSSQISRGTTFEIHLPANCASPAQKAEGRTQSLPRGSGECVLVIDDEAPIRSIARQTLEAFGYRVLLAVDGAEAIAIYAKHHADIALVLTDMMMPIMDGPATIQVLTKINPQVILIAASGMTTSEQANRATGGVVKQFLAKPYTAESMLRTVASVLGSN